LCPSKLPERLVKYDETDRGIVAENTGWNAEETIGKVEMR
jgi:hypothetical protein